MQPKRQNRSQTSDNYNKTQTNMTKTLNQMQIQQIKDQLQKQGTMSKTKSANIIKIKKIKPITALPQWSDSTVPQKPEKPPTLFNAPPEKEKRPPTPPKPPANFKVRKIQSVDPTKRQVLNNNQQQNIQNSKYVPGSLDTHKDDKGNSFVILKAMTMDELDKFLINHKNIQTKKVFLYQDIMNTAKDLDLKTPQEIQKYKDILLQAMQPCFFEPDYWYHIMYWLSKQYYFFNGNTKEMSKRHPKFYDYQKMLYEKKNTNFVDIENVTQEFLEKYISILENKASRGDLSEEEELKYQVLEKTLNDLNLKSVEHIRICQQYVMEAVTLGEQFKIIKNMDGKQKKIQIYDRENFSFNDFHPDIINLRKQCKKLLKTHHTEIPNLQMQDFGYYIGKQEQDKDKQEVLEIFLKHMNLLDNPKEIIDYKEQIWEQIEKTNSEWQPIRMTYDQKIMFKRKNVPDQQIDDFEVIPPGILDSDLFHALVPQITSKDMDQFINKDKSLDDVKFKVIQKVTQDMGILNEKGIFQNKDLILSVFEDPKYQNFKPVVLLRSKDIAFKDMKEGDLLAQIPNLPKPIQPEPQPKITQEIIQQFINTKTGKEKIELAGIDPKIVQELDNLYNLLNLNPNNVQEFMPLMTKAFQYDDKDCLRVKIPGDEKIYYQNNETFELYEQPPNYPSSDDLRDLFIVIPAITEKQIDDYIKNDGKNLSQEIKNHIKKLADKMGMKSADDFKKFGAQLKKIAVNSIEENWEHIKKLDGTIMYRNKDTGEIKEYPNNFPTQEQIDKMEIIIDRFNEEELQQFALGQKLDHPIKQKMLEKYCDKLDLKTPEDIKIFAEKVLNNPLIANLGKEWDIIERKDGSFGFKNSDTQEFLEYPVGFPDSIDKNSLCDKLDNFTKEDILNFIDGKEMDPFKKQMLEKVCQQLGLTDIEQMKNFQDLIEKTLIDNLDNKWDFIKKMGDGSLQFQNKETGEFSELPPGMLSKEDLLNVKKQQKKIGAQDIENYINNNLDNLDKNMIQELDNVILNIGQPLENKEQFKNLLNKLYIEDLDKCNHINKHLFLNGEQKYIDDTNQNVIGNDLYKNLKNEISQEEILKFLNDEQIDPLKERELKNALEFLGVSNTKEDKNQYKDILLQYNSDKYKDIKKIPLHNSQDIIFINENGEIMERHPILYSLQEQIIEQNKFNSIQDLPKITKEDIEQFNKDKSQLDKDLAQNIEEFYNDLNVTGEWQRQKYQLFFVKQAELAKEKRVTYQGKVGYLIKEDPIEISNFPLSIWPNKEQKEKIHLKMDNISKEEIQLFVKDELKDEEKKLSLEKSANYLKLKNKEDLQEFQVLLEEVSELSDEWQRVRFIHDDSEKYLNKKDKLITEIAPNMYPDEQLKDIVIDYRLCFTPEDYDQQIIIDKQKDQEKEEKEAKVKKQKTVVTENQNLTDKQIYQQQFDEFLNYVGLKSLDDRIQFKDFIIDQLGKYDQDQFKCQKYLISRQVCFNNTKNDDKSFLPPNADDIKIGLEDEKKKLILKQEAIGASRVDNLYVAKFQNDSMQKDLQIIGADSSGIQVKSSADGANIKFAILNPSLKKQTIRRFTFIIKQITPGSIQGIGLCQQVNLPDDMQVQGIENIPPGTFFINANGKELLSKQDIPKYQETLEKLGEQPFEYKTDDIVIAEIDLFKGMIIYTNPRTDQNYKQKITKIDGALFIGLCLSSPEDQVQILPRSDFPLHFTLTWEDQNVDMDIHLSCPCGNHMYEFDKNSLRYHKNKKCDSCQTFLDKDHIYGENPVEHIYIRKIPKQGQVWKCKVKYYAFQTEDKKTVSDLQEGVSENLQYSVAIYYVSNQQLKDKYYSIQRIDGVLQTIGKERKFKYKFDFKSIKQFLEQEQQELQGDESSMLQSEQQNPNQSNQN